MQEKQEECEIMHLFSFLFSIFADNMQILLASAKIMNDKVSAESWGLNDPFSCELFCPMK